jgi:hypothetical protein
MVSPSSVARDRYQRCFQSSLFDPPDEPRRLLAPAGKRRDQTVTELFGEANQGKNLTYQEGTFEPRSDKRSARQKKQEFLDSQVLPKTHFDAADGEAVLDQLESEGEDTGVPVTRRLHENRSHILGGEMAPHEDAAAQEARYYESRLRPTSFRWYQYPEEAAEAVQPGSPQTAANRAFHEKQSTIFDHQTQDSQGLYSAEIEDDKKFKSDAERKRRANCYYSDLFGRETPFDEKDKSRFPKPKGAPEDRIIIHGEWTDSRTEIERGAGEANGVTAADRKRHEFNATKVFNGELEGGQPTPFCDTKPEQCLTYTDNSAKVERHSVDVKALHQQHLQSTVMGDGFYHEAEGRTAVAVAELHIAGLKPDMDGRAVTLLVQQAGFHVIKADANMDPVNNRCKGTCKLQVRYNPGPGNSGLEPIDRLVQYLGRHGLQAAM